MELLTLEEATKWAQQSAQVQDWSGAAQRWAILRKAYPQQSAPWLQGARCSIKAGLFTQAERLLDHGRQHFPDNPNAFIISAELAIEQQHWDIAESFLLQCRENFAYFPQTWMMSALCSERQGYADQALQYNQQARKSFPELTTPYLQYAELAERAGQWQEALQRWALLRTCFPEFPGGYRRAAQAARKLGQHALARKLLLSYEYGDDLLAEPYEINNCIVKNESRLKHFFELIWVKATFSLRSEVKRNYLSYSWWIFEPILHMLVYYIVFGLLMARGDENFLAFLLSGLIPWMWFSKVISGSSGSILAGQNLMLQVGMPSLFFPLVTLLKASLQQLPVYLLLLVFVWIQGFPPDLLWLALIPVILVQFVLTAAIACTVAAIIPFMRDLNYLVNTGLMFVMFVSGIFYDYRTLTAEWQSLFLLNPVAFLLKSYREILIDGVTPDFITLTWWGTGSTLVCLLLIWIYSKLRYIYPRIVVE